MTEPQDSRQPLWSNHHWSQQLEKCPATFFLPTPPLFMAFINALIDIKKPLLVIDDAVAQQSEIGFAEVEVFLSQALGHLDAPPSD